MWEESQAENTKLRLELSGTRGDLETARNHLSSAEKKVTPDCRVRVDTHQSEIVTSKLNLFSRWSRITPLRIRKREKRKLLSRNWQRWRRN